MFKLNSDKKILDITGILKNNIWKYPDPYNPVIINNLPEISWVDGPCYSQNFSMSAQSGTYIETWAHWDNKAPTVDMLPIENYFHSAIIILLPKKLNEAVTLKEVKSYLEDKKEKINKKDAVLIGTGWDKFWDDKKKYLHDNPFLDEECFKWIVDQGAALIGMDVPRFIPPSYNYNQTAKYFKNFLSVQGNTILVSIVNLYQAKQVRGGLITFPLKLFRTVASPCRAILTFT